MRQTPIKELGKFLLGGQISRLGCVRRPHRFSYWSTIRRSPSCQHPVRALQTGPDSSSVSVQPPAVPLRKQLKDKAKEAKKQGKRKPKGELQSVDGWELTVGIEIHAQLNTTQKLFSPALTSFNDEPNSHVALFDVAVPGSQPQFQKETLIPALRAALALECEIQPVSKFDRKHYFWWDQPSGYQITQYYHPFAKNGKLTLFSHDGISPEDGESVTVRIKQIQLEQDTAKTIAQTGNTSWLDFNRVGVPLIEIITEPDMHHPRTAAVFVRKVQLLLNMMDSCVSGMETGGLRADVNVSVRRTDGTDKLLGTRTEIKNLSTIKAIEDAIIAERDRQIRELDAGGVIAGETRGWSIGSTETRRLRGKEGEVDYRYMPDPDLAPLRIGDDLVKYLQSSLPLLPEVELRALVGDYGLTAKDAQSLMALDNGARIQYFYQVLGLSQAKLEDDTNRTDGEPKSLTTLVGNWVIHELGRLIADKAELSTSGELSFTPHGDCSQVPATDLADLLYYLYQTKITGKVAKELLLAIYLGNIEGSVLETIEANDLWFHEISQEGYVELAKASLEGEDKLLEEFRTSIKKNKYPQGKLMYLVGKMMRLGSAESINPGRAESVMRDIVDKLVKSEA